MEEQEAAHAGLSERIWFRCLRFASEAVVVVGFSRVRDVFVDDKLPVLTGLSTVLFGLEYSESVEGLRGCLGSP